MLTKGGQQKAMGKEIGRLKMHRLSKIYKYTKKKIKLNLKKNRYGGK